MKGTSVGKSMGSVLLSTTGYPASHAISWSHHIAGWWFGTFFIFHNIWDKIWNIWNIFHIFFLFSIIYGILLLNWTGLWPPGIFYFPATPQRASSFRGQISDA